MDATQETWLPVVGYEGRYEVSSHGRIKSLARRDIGNGRGGYRDWPEVIRRQFDHKLGYKMVRLHLDGHRSGKYVHALVLEAFVGPRPDGMYACHSDGNPANNCVDNLRWDTPSANQQDSIRHGTHAEASKTHCGRGHEFTLENTYVHPVKKSRQCRQCVRDANSAKRKRSLTQ